MTIKAKQYNMYVSNNTKCTHSYNTICTYPNKPLYLPWNHAGKGFEGYL